MSRFSRIKACELAAVVLAGRSETEGLAPLAWSLCVFFECYIDRGADETKRDFGPKRPVRLKVAS